MPPKHRKNPEEQIKEDALAFLSDAYKLCWCARFLVRMRVLPFLAYLIAGLLVLEILIPLVEGSPLLIEASGNYFLREVVKLAAVSFMVHVLFALVAIAVSILMALHHHRLKDQLRRLKVLESMVARLLFEGSGLAIRDENIIATLIQAALEALRNTLTDVSVVTLLKIENGAGEFRTFDQHPIGANDRNVVLPKKGSTAESALDTDGIVVVPRTQFRFGVILWASFSTFRDSEPQQPKYSYFQTIPNAFINVIAGEEAKRLRAITCIQVPTKSSASARWVLCIDSEKNNPFRETHFQALQLMAAVIGALLGDFQFPNPN
jgi:hypothetical protein